MLYLHHVGIDVDGGLVGGLAVGVDGDALVLAGVLLHLAAVHLQGDLLTHAGDGGVLTRLQLLAVPAP